MALPKKFGKALGAAFIGMLLLFLLAFFVSLFLVSRGNPSVDVKFGKGMMSDSLQVGVPSMMADSLSFDTAAVPGRMMGRANVGGILENSAAPMMGTEKKVIKNGALNLRVADADQTLERINQIVGEAGGDIIDSRFSESVSGQKSGTVTVKVPVSKFNEIFNRLKEVATVVLSESTSGADVTEQYIDLQARINNKKVAEATLQVLYQRAEKISDVIEVTDKLTQVRGEIESLEGQLRYLNGQTDMASITLSLVEDATVVADQGFRPMQTLKESLVTLIRMLGAFTQGLIRFVVVGLPVLLVYGVILWFVYRLTRKMVMWFWPGRDEAKRVMRKK